MGDSYATALSKGIKFINPEFVNLADNRMTNVGSSSIIKSLKGSVKYLNVSQNQIDGEGANILGDFLKSKANMLRGLNLENTKLGDSGTIALCQQLVDHPRLTDLNLAKNHITDASCDAISTLISDTFYLASLILHWNLITGEGATKILKASMRNTNIKVIDFSWNRIGSLKGKLFAHTLADILTAQENLVHLDVSHNKIKEEDCKTIAAALEGNHSLWGIHFAGNSTYSIDSKGFMINNVNSAVPMGTDHLEVRLNAAKMVVSNVDQEGAKLKRAHNCWICEGWNEALFEFPIAKQGEPVYLYSEWDDYKGDLMYTEPDISKDYIMWRMVPPGRNKYFFVTEGKAILSNKYPKMKYPMKMKVFFAEFIL